MPPNSSINSPLSDLPSELQVSPLIDIDMIVERADDENRRALPRYQTHTHHADGNRSSPRPRRHSFTDTPKQH